MMEVSGNSQEELKTSLHSQTLIPIDADLRVEPSPRQPTSPVADKTITAAAEMEVQSKYPGSRLVSIDRLGKYGRAKIIQVIPNFYSKSPGPVATAAESQGANYQIHQHSRDLANHETVTTIQAQMVSLSFYYGPDFTILDYPLRPRFQRGEIILPDQFWMVDYHLPTHLDGTNLLSNLVARLKKRYLSIDERLALNPHGDLGDETFSLSHRKARLPISIKEEISKLESKIPEALSKLTAWHESKKGERENLTKLKTQITPLAKRLNELKVEKDELGKVIRETIRATATNPSVDWGPHVTRSSLNKAKKLNEEEIELQGRIQEIRDQATKFEAEIEAPLKVIFDDVINVKKKNAEDARIPRYFDRFFYIPLSIQLRDQLIEDTEWYLIGPIKLEDHTQTKIHFTQKIKIPSLVIPEISRTNLFHPAQSEFIFKIKSTDHKNTLFLSIDRINSGGLMPHLAEFLIYCDPSEFIWTLNSMKIPPEEHKIQGIIPIKNTIQITDIERHNKIYVREAERIDATKLVKKLVYTLRISDQIITLSFQTRPELTPTLEEITDTRGGPSERLTPTKRSASEMTTEPR